MMKELKIYFTSDLHGYVYPTDYIERNEKNILKIKKYSIYLIS